MHISILGQTEIHAEADALAEELATRLCVPMRTDARKPGAEYRLIVTASHQGTAEAVRRGAGKAAVRYVKTHSLGPPDPSVTEGRDAQHGYYLSCHIDPLDRLHQIESASMLVFLALNRRNAGLLLNTVYALSEEVRGISGLHVERRKILLWAGAIADRGEAGLHAEVLQHFLGSTVDASDVQNITVFRTVDEAVAIIEAYNAQLAEVFKPK